MDNLGKIIAVVTIAESIQMTDEFIKTQSPLELACGYYNLLRIAWRKTAFYPLKSKIPIKGYPWIFSASDEIVKEVKLQLPELFKNERTTN